MSRVAGMSISTCQTIDTELCADSVEWCPLTDLQDVLVCGTYQLQEQSEAESNEEQTRVGRLYLYALSNQSGSPSLEQLTSQDMPGVLDIKWSYHPVAGQACFALVNSVGELRVYKLLEDRSVAMVTRAELTPQSLGLSLEWNNMTGNSENTMRVVSSDSTGQIHVHQVGESSLVALETWKAHDYEAWIAAFNQNDTQIVYTGGDDCRLKGWDLRVGTASPVFNSKRHTMGVCSIQSNPVQPHLLATGSYDEELYIWDSRQMSRPQQSVSLGGGVWRVKWEPCNASQILTATMYNGFHIINVTDNACDIVCHYKEHQSIAYGADWCRIPTDSAGKQICDDPEDRQATRCQPSSPTHTIATCSFYDHLLKLWTVK
ncbi:diphthine methyltransferase-like [Mya arenaria]|uniref:diphthine methyltransferase-like n=1 Tax=Mya arenaria TaxID=6604 RepID=UPI0022E792F7|nr:diphthine methyltransferase-like [Mya arenaria]XP_052814899.1 diphthine methyltransferase-like [Mya arenaria]